MKLPAHAIIAGEKVTRYLLVPQTRADKSAYLARAGFVDTNPRLLLQALRQLAREAEAFPLENTKFGQVYEIRGRLAGPNGVALPVRTIWITEHLSGVTRFVTLISDLRRSA